MYLGKATKFVRLFLAVFAGILDVFSLEYQRDSASSAMEQRSGDWVEKQHQETRWRPNFIKKDLKVKENFEQIHQCLEMEDSDFDESELFATFDDIDSSNKDGIRSKPVRKKSISIEDTELEILKSENEQLRKVLRRIAFSYQSSETPLASILYFDCRHGNAANIEEMMKYFAICKKKERSDVDDPKYNGYKVSSSEQCSSFCDAFALAFGRCHREEDVLNYDIPGIPSGSVQYFNSYCLDRFGSSVVDLSFGERYNYEQVYFNILPNLGQSGKTRRPKATCFNCDGDHKLQECTEPRNLVRISAKRQEFMANFSSPAVQEARYHADKEKQMKFQHLIPGEVSAELRQALGMTTHDLPPFIYRMRMLGYPTGWLPSNHDSGIVIHGKEGKADDTNSEEKSLDHDKCVQFPGFNVAVPTSAKDLSDEVRLPRMDPRYQLQLSRTSAETTPSRKHRLSSEDVDNDRDRKRRRTSDMDIDDNLDNEEKTTPRTPTNGRCSSSLPPNFLQRTSTPVVIDLEDGEIPDSPRTDENSTGPDSAKDITKRAWWFEEPLVFSGVKGDSEVVPPPFPLRPLPLHKISQILPGEMNHISFEDRNLWLDPIFGNLQIRTGRYDRLKTILANREKKKM